MGWLGGGGSSVTEAEIPEELKPLAEKYAAEAIKMFNTPYQAYDGQRYAQFDPYQTQALSMIADRAKNGDDLMDAGYQKTMQTINGKFLNPNSNPWLKQNVQTAMDQAMGSINSQFNRPGAFGSTAHEGVAANQLGNISAQMYGQNYAQERDRMMSALGLAPTFGNAAYADAAQLMNAGQVKQDQAQQGLDWNLEKFREKQDYPYKQLAAASGVFGTNLGGKTTTTGGGK